MKHTRLPWRNSNSGGSGIDATWETGEEVRVCSVQRTMWSTDPRYDDVELNRRRNARMREENEANKEFILLAVNAHEALLEACKAALNMVDGDGHPPDWDKLRAAIKLAEGETK